MIRKILTLLVLIAPFIAAQDSGVELPDFVITGKDVVSVGKTEKIPPDFISTISETFLKPVFPTENLQMNEVNTPVKGAISQIDSLNYLTGSFNAGLGSYSLPKTDLTFSSPFNNGLFEGFAGANNTRAYVSNSDRYSLDGGASLSLYTDDDASFLPGTQFKFSGEYITSSYKFFASDNPGLKRTVDNGSASFEINNLMGEYFIYSAKLSDENVELKNEKFSENLFNLSGYAQLTLPFYNLGIEVNDKKQILTNNFINKSNIDFISSRPTMGVSFSQLFNITFGLNYQHSDSNNFISPYASMAVNFNKNLSLYTEYSPQAEFWGGGYFLHLNDYFMAENFSNIFLKKNVAFSAALKYEYYTYVEINGGVKYFKSDNLPYFFDTTNGIFDLATFEAKSYSAFVNFLFHPGPGGTFYATVEANNTKNELGNIVPYFPEAKATFNYGYSFANNLETETSLTYLSGIHTDLNNDNTIRPYINLGLKLSYQLFPEFYLTIKISNLINHNNYLWQGYKEMPQDFLVGLNYRW
ncbi:MAG: TonB-dependent receptor [Ignavibacteriaceae bacterium]|jgi:hypothetical protein